MNSVITVWVITWRIAWPLVLAGGALLALAGLAAKAERETKWPPTKALVLVLGTPLSLIVWSGLNWAAEQHLPARAIGWRSMVLIALAVASVAVATMVAVRFRYAPRRWLLFSCAAIAVLYTVIAWFVGGMAIVNDWL